MTNLVTGAAGFIGSRVCSILLADGQKVVGVDCLRDYYDPAIKRRNVEELLSAPSFVFSQGDLSLGTGFLDDLLPRDEPIVVLHLAARAGVRTSWGGDFPHYTRDNIASTQMLLEWAVSRGSILHFVYASSSSVYGVSGDLPMTEDLTVPVPHSPYGVTKLAGENLVRLYGDNCGLTWTALRLFTVFGPGQRPDMAFHRFIRDALAGRPITLYGNGTQTRDFTFVDDIVRGMLLARDARGGLVINLAGGVRVSMNRIVEILQNTLGRHIDVNRLAAQPGDVPDTWACTDRARTILGWSPEYSLEEGLALEAAWLRSL